MIELEFSKQLGQFDLQVGLHVKKGSFLALTGKSGAGKTTLLRLIAGLEKGSGRLVVDGELWQDEEVFLPPQKRKIGFVFQDFALFPNMNVLENLLFVEKNPKKARHLLEICSIWELRDAHVKNLSGGQKQRVALCRALMNNPKLLLLDEPLSALDFDTRDRLQDEILKLHEEFGTTSILVSHNISEIYKLADELIVLEGGKIIKKGGVKQVLLKTSGSQKLSLVGKVLEIKKVDIIYVAIIALNAQIVEVVLDSLDDLVVGDEVVVSAKAFLPRVTKL